MYSNFKAQRENVIPSGFLRFWGIAEIEEQGPHRDAVFAKLAKREQEHAGADYLKFYQLPSVGGDPLAQSWYGRGQNFLVAYTRAEPGAVLARTAQPDEY